MDVYNKYIYNPCLHLYIYIYIYIIYIYILRFYIYTPMILALYGRITISEKYI